MHSAMLLVLLVIAVLPVTASPCGQHLGTTTNINAIFKGRCREYVQKINPAPFCDTNKKDCDTLWENFVDVLYNRSSCHMTAEMYSEFIGKMSHSIPIGKSMFWQGVNGFVQELSYQGKRFFALEDTLYGYTLNKLNWCWSEDFNDFNYTICPNRNLCPNGTLTAYWEVASRQFAKTASGAVRVMINGSRTPPYNRSGFFGRVELPAMDKTKVDNITILLIHFIGAPVVEKCDGKSITQLQEDVRNRGIAVECIDDPRWVHFYLCVDSPSSTFCQSAGKRREISAGLLFIILLLVYDQF